MIFSSGDDGHYIANNCDPEDFIDRTAQQFFCFVAALFSANDEPPSVVTIGTQIKTSRPELVPFYYQVCEYPLSGELVGVQEFVEAFKADSYAKRFKSIIDGCQKAFEQKFPVTKIKARLEQRIEALDAGTRPDRLFDDKNKQAEEVIEYVGASGDKPGLRFGYDKMDRVLVPILDGHLVLLGGPTGTGKSTIARNLVANWLVQGARVAEFTLEMTAVEQMVNMVAMDTGLDVKRIWERDLTGEEKMQVAKSLGQLKKSPIIFNEKAHQTPDSILKAMKRYRSEGYDTFVIDHLHRVDYGTDELRVPVGRFAGALKNFAMQHSCRILALVQLKKRSKHEEPNDEDIRESAAIGEEAHLIMFTYRPLVAGYYGGDGVFVPNRTATGGRYFEHNAPQNAEMGMDNEHVFLKLGKQRIRPVDALFMLPFNERSGRILN